MPAVEYDYILFNIYFPDQEWYLPAKLSDKQNAYIEQTLKRIDMQCTIHGCGCAPWNRKMLSYPDVSDYMNSKDQNKQVNKTVDIEWSLGPDCPHTDIVQEFRSVMVGLGREREYLTLGRLEPDLTKVTYTLDELPKRIHRELNDKAGSMTRVCYSDPYNRSSNYHGNWDGYKEYRNVRQLPWSPDAILSSRGSCGVIHGSNSGVFGDDNFAPGVPTYTYGLCEICKSIIKHAHALIRHELMQYNIECAEYLESMQRPVSARLDRILPKKADEIGLPTTIAKFVYEACKQVNENCNISDASYYDTRTGRYVECDAVRWSIDAVLNGRDYCGVEPDSRDEQHICSSCDTLTTQIWKHIGDMILESDPLLSGQPASAEVVDMYYRVLVDKHLAEFT